MDLLIGTLALRPYVFGFLAAFLVAGSFDLGWRRTLGFAAWVWLLAWVAEASSTRIGIPFGLYHYTGSTRGQELYLADMPLMDSLSFTFLAYAAFCLARATLARRRPSKALTAALAGTLMMALDIVIDPVAVRGDRWFLGRIFYYPMGGIYFGVPLSNFVGWLVVGMVAVGGYVYWSGGREAGADGGWPAGRAEAVRRTRGAVRWSDQDAARLRPARIWPGVALYYAVLGFNLAVTAWIGESVLLAAGLTLHGLLALALSHVSRRPETRIGVEIRETHDA